LEIIQKRGKSPAADFFALRLFRIVCLTLNNALSRSYGEPGSLRDRREQHPQRRFSRTNSNRLAEEISCEN
jgi:hypothetical protein